MRAYGPARHKAGITCRLNLDPLLTMNINYRYCDTTSTFSATDLPSDMCQRLDLTLSRTIANGQGELMVGVLDVFNLTISANRALNALTSYETPGRTFFARLQIKF